MKHIANGHTSLLKQHYGKNSLQSEIEMLRGNLSSISSTSRAGAQKLREEYLKILNALQAKVLRKLVDDASKDCHKDVGRIDGLEVLRIINEPTAASLTYGFERKNKETILVFDLGGGTFDVSVLEVGDGVFEVLSTSGDTHLGGDDFDKRIVDWLAAEFKRNEGIDLMKVKQALQRLTEIAEKAKMDLSSQTNIRLLHLMESRRETCYL